MPVFIRTIIALFSTSRKSVGQFLMKNNTIILALIFALGSSYLTYQYTTGQQTKAVLEVERKANEKLLENIERVYDQQIKILEFQTKLEREYVKQNEEISKKLADYSRRVDDGFRLFDRYAKERSGDSSGPNSGTAADHPGASGGRELSREATEFLLQLAGEADRVVAQLKACQEYVKSLRENVNQE